MTDCRTTAVGFALLLLLVPAVLCGQSPAASTWESIGPEGGYLTDIVRNPANWDLFAVSYGYPTRLYKSSNGGDTWTNVSQIDNNIQYLLLDPQSPQTMYAASSYLGYGTSLGFYKSTDGGLNWIWKSFPGEALTNYYIQEFYLDRSDPNKVSFVGYSYKSEGSTTTYRTYLARSTNKGESWTLRHFDNVTTEQFYAYCLETDPMDGNTIYVGGYSYLPPGYVYGRVFRTTDNGSSWTNITGTVVQGYVYDILTDMSTPGKVFAISYAGVYRSTDKGTSWTRCSGSAWGGRLLCDPSNPATMYAYSQGLYCFRSTDAGVTWTSLTSGLAGGSTNELVIHPTLSGTLFMATRAGFYRSTNSGQTWSASNRGLLAAEVPALRCLPTSPKTLYISFMYNGLYRTSNALGKAAPSGLMSVTWEKMPEYSYCEGIKQMQVSPTAGNVIYIQEGAG